METFGPIQVQPQGLLGFMNLKNVGKNPRDIQDLIVPTIDVGNWWLHTNDTNEFSDVEVAFAGPAGFNSFNPPLIVPQKEWWYVTSCNLHGIDGAVGSTITVGLVAQLSRPIAIAVFGPWQILSRNGGPYITVDAASPTVLATGFDIWLPPGSEICMHVRANTGGQNIRVAGRYARLPV